MEALVGLLIVGGLLISWIIAGVNFARGGILLKFFGQVALCVVLIFIYWIFIVLPVLGCRGFLCGLDEILLFVLLSGVTILLWGIILLVYSNNHYSKKKLSTKKIETEVLDTPSVEDEEF